jgi:hypothetical protein
MSAKGKHFEQILFVSGQQCDKKLNKISPNLGEKVAENAKISTPELNLKAQNIHIKLLLKPYNKPLVETACLGEN